MGDPAKPWTIGPYFQSTKMLGERGCKTKYPNVYSPFGKLSPFLSCVNCRQSEATRHTLLLPLIKAQSDFLLGITTSLLCSCTAIIHIEMNTQAGSPQGLTYFTNKKVSLVLFNLTDNSTHFMRGVMQRQRAKRNLLQWQGWWMWDPWKHIEGIKWTKTGSD